MTIAIAVAVAPVGVGRKQGAQGGQEVVVASRAGLQDGDSGCGVRDEDVEQAVAAVGGAGEELFAVGRQVGDALGRACGDVQDLRTEGVGHGPILARRGKGVRALAGTGRSRAFTELVEA